MIVEVEPGVQCQRIKKAIEVPSARRKEKTSVFSQTVIVRSHVMSHGYKKEIIIVVITLTRDI